MRWCHREVFISILLAASIQAVQGADLRRGFPTPAPSEVEGSPSTLTPLEWGQNKSSFSSGILWNINQEEDSASRVIPRDVHCKKEGLNPIPAPMLLISSPIPYDAPDWLVISQSQHWKLARLSQIITKCIFVRRGSCQKFIYCKDLSGEGVEDWYILLFTCPEGQVFEDTSGKCKHLSSVKWSPECHSDSRDHVSEKTFNHNRFLDDEGLTKQNTLTTSNSTSEEKHPGTLKDSLKQDDSCDDDVSVACGVPGKDELNKNGTVTSANVHQEIELPSLDISRQNNGSVRDNTSDFPDQYNVQERKKRFANSLETNKNIVKIIAQEAVEVCNDMKNINEYVTHVMSRRPLQFTYKEDFLVDILNVYNQNLKSAQTNTKSWDQRRGILEAITEVFNLVREFGPKLKTRFHSMKTSIATVPKTDQNFEKNAIDMKKLKEEIERLEAQIKSITYTDDMEIIFEFLEHMIEEKRLELWNLTQKNGMYEKEFQQLAEIVEYVLNNSIEIQGKSSKAVRLMEAFHRTIYQDSSKFNTSISKAQMGRRAIEMTKKKTQKEIIDHKNRIDAAKREIEKNQHLLRAYREQVEEAKHDIAQYMWEMEAHAERNHDMAVAGGILMVIPVLGWITGGVLLGVGIEERKRALRMKEDARSHLERMIIDYENNVAILENIVAREEQIINKLVSAITTFESSLLALQEINGSLQSMERSATSIMPYITRAVSVLGGLKDVFSSVEDDLKEMKQEVNEAYIKAKQGEGSYFGYEAVEEKVQGPWEDARSKIISVGDCVPRN